MAVKEKFLILCVIVAVIASMLAAYFSGDVLSSLENSCAVVLAFGGGWAQFLLE